MEQETTVERKFDISGPARLSLANISGSVDIQPGDEGAMLVIAEKDPNSGDATRTRIEMEQSADGSVVVKTDYGESFWRWFGQRPCDVDYTVRVPRNCSVQLNCVSSSGQVKGLNGRFDLSVVSGDLNVADLNGALKLNAVSGKMSGERLAGTAEVETVSGELELRACSFESAKISTVSGRVAVETPVAKGPYRFHSVSGGVQLAVPADARCTVEGTSISGRLSSDLPVTRSQKSGQRWHLEVQGGGPEIRFDSISGGLLIECSDRQTPVATSMPAVKSTGAAPAMAAANVQSMPVAPSAPVAPLAPAGPGAPETPGAELESAAQTRREILDRVARGELSVDEAIKVLHG